MSETTCKECPFYVPFKEPSVTTSDGASMGTCRRFPPRAMVTPESNLDGRDGLTTENPTVASYWFCGEHPLRQRDRLAAMAMQGEAAGAASRGAWDFRGMAERAYAVADAMLRARGE